jgi:hypothetical protein
MEGSSLVPSRHWLPPLGENHGCACVHRTHFRPGIRPACTDAAKSLRAGVSTDFEVLTGGHVLRCILPLHGRNDIPCLSAPRNYRALRASDQVNVLKGRRIRRPPQGHPTAIWGFDDPTAKTIGQKWAMSSLFRVFVAPAWRPIDAAHAIGIPNLWRRRIPDPGRSVDAELSQASLSCQLAEAFANTLSRIRR